MALSSPSKLFLKVILVNVIVSVSVIACHALAVMLSRDIKKSEDQEKDLKTKDMFIHGFVPAVSQKNNS